MSNKRRNKRRRNPSPANQPEKPAEPPKQAPYTLQQLMQEYGEPTLEPTPKERETIRVFHDHYGNIIDIDASEVLETLDDQTRTDLSDMLDSAGFPPDAEPHWPEPGDLTLPPDATTETVTTLADVMLHITEGITASATQPATRTDLIDLLNHLGCLQVSSEDLNDLINRLGQLAGPAQPAAATQALLQRFTATQNDCQVLFEEYQQNLNNAMHGIPEMKPEDTEPQASGTRRIRVRAHVQAMAYCAQKRRDSRDEAERHAYRHWLFDLHHHNLQYWQEPPSYNERDTQNREANNMATAQHIADSQRIHQQELDDFNASLDTYIGTAFDEATPQVLEMVRNIPVETLEFTCGVLVDPKPRPLALQPGTANYFYSYSYVAFFHNGKRHVKGVGEHYPPAYPGELVIRQMERVIEESEHPDPDILERVVQTAKHMQTIATYQLHSVTQDGMKNVITKAREANMSPGAIHDLIDAVADYDHYLAESMLSTAGVKTPPASRHQTRTILQAARKAGLDEHQLADIATALRHFDFDKLGIKLPAVPRQKADAVIEAAQQAGFPQRAINVMLETMLYPD